ncbi:uncharacterized protein [Temnothorax longispinosus]|uniref:uncharacterized protein n=1 Tax=Temnothorax longispinosus TaxID=300112 RepID=UPI003A993CDC
MPTTNTATPPTATEATTTTVQSVFTIETFDNSKFQWDRWVERLEGAFTIFNVAENRHQLHYLLYFMGPEAYDTLCDKVAPAKPAGKTYEEVVELMQQYYSPAPLKIAENFRFHQRRQHEGESVRDFQTGLQKLAIHCKFGEYLKTALRNQFVFGLCSEKIQNRLLESKDLNLDRAFEIALAMELSARDAAELHHSGVVHALNARTKNNKYTKMPIRGHIRKVCNKAKRAAQTNQLTEESDVDEIVALDEFAELEEVAETFQAEHTTSSKIFHYAMLRGFAPVKVAYKNRDIELNIYVIKNERAPLLGKEWIRQLHLNIWEEEKEQINHLDTERVVKSLVADFPAAFGKGIGKIEGIAARLYLKEDARPLFRKARQVPFALKPKIEETLRNLEAQGVLTKVDTSENLSTLLYPLHQLLHDDTEFVWTDKCKKAFRTVKERIQLTDCLVHFDPRLPIILVTDASPYGVRAVFSHSYDDKTERPIQFASQTLSKTQLPVRTTLYLYTDHKPLVQIFNPNKGLPMLTTTRMEHYAIYLQAFTYDIKYKDSKSNANAYAISRLPIASEKFAVCDEPDVLEIAQIETLPITVSKLANETSNEPSLQALC